MGEITLDSHPAPRRFAAPWCRLLVFTSILSLLLIAIFALAPHPEPEGMHYILGWMKASILAVVAGAGLFTVRGYTVAGNEILIHRLLWATRLPLDGIQSAKLQPGVMKGSIRLFGNGGMFSITGFYRNAALGNYRAYVTSPDLTVVLRYPHRTVVISPKDGEEFVELIAQNIQNMRADISTFS